MSETPRTDEQELAYVAEDGSTYVHTTFARKLEREIRQLEVAIYDGKKEAAELRQMLAELHEVNAELHKDAQRLDWLLNRAYTIQLREGDILTSREEIDKEMEEQNYEI